MANEWLNIYKNNPTAGGTDGTAVSTGGTFTAPINFKLDASKSESQTVKLAVRTESGYVANDVTLSDYNDTNDRLKLCLTENGTYTDSLTIGSVSAVNTVFYARAGSSSSESPTTDRSIQIKYSGEIATV